MNKTLHAKGLINENGGLVTYYSVPKQKQEIHDRTGTRISEWQSHNKPIFNQVIGHTFNNTPIFYTSSGWISLLSRMSLKLFCLEYFQTSSKNKN